MPKPKPKPKFKQRLAVADITNISHEDFTLTDEQWEILEDEYAYEIPQDARARLLEICNQYFFQRQAELAAIPLNDIRDLSDHLIKCSKKYLNITGLCAYPEKFSKEVIEDYEFRLNDALRSYEEVLIPGQIQITKDMPEEVKKYLSENMVSVRQSNTTIMNSSLAMLTATKAVEKEIKSIIAIQEVGFREGQAWTEFLNACKEWTGEHDLPWSKHKEPYRASNFSNMLNQLQLYFPKTIPHITVNGGRAMADQLKEKTKR